MPEDEKPDAEKPEGTVTDTAVETPPEPEARFTQADMDRVAKAERAKGKRQGRTEAQQAVKAKTQATETPTTEPPSNDSKVLDKIDELTQRFEKSEHDRLFAETVRTVPGADKFNADQIDMLRTAFDPAEPEAMVEKAKRAFGAAADSQQKPSSEGGPPEGIANQYEAPGAPSGAPRDVSTDAFSWTKDDIDRMDKDGSLLENVEKWRSQWEDGGSTLFRKRIPKG